MKIRVSNLFKSILLLSVLAICLLMGSKTCLAVQPGKGLDGIKTLEKDKVYEYDLNGDGKTEKIQYKVAVNDEEFTVSFKLYINNKLCMSRKDHGFLYTLQICDLDKNDKLLDLYGYGTMESDCISYSFFARYDKNNQFKYKNFNPEKLIKHLETGRYSLATIHGDGRFDFIVDTPFYSEAIGCYCCYVPFQIKNDVISAISVKTYILNKSSKQYKYTAAKSFSVYVKEGSKKIAYTVKKGEKITLDTLGMTASGKVYFKIINGKGKTGWINSDQKNLFITIPQWG